jgi:RNA-splicing ligase RtcB
MNQDNKAVVRVVASARTWIEGDAVQQLETTARLPGMRAAIGMPDLHPGKGSPIGAAFVCEGHLYPHLVGNDIGCGMGLWQTDLLRRKLKRDRWADRLDDLDERWDGDTAAALGGLAASEHDGSLGTIGGGNHFAELQQVERVEDAAALAGAGWRSTSCACWSTAARAGSGSRSCARTWTRTRRRVWPTTRRRRRSTCGATITRWRGRGSIVR